MSRHDGPSRLPSASALTIALPDLDATTRLACGVASLVRTGDAILLDGPLGAGKSAFARAFLRAASGDAALEVPSPSFTLVQTYDTPRGRMHHFDLWRLADAAALEELGWDEARQEIVIVEWPDRLGPLRPDDSLDIALTLDPAPEAAERRHARIVGWPDRIAALA